MVRENGFPGSSQHPYCYRNLKWKSISKAAARFDELHCWTGVRRQESDRRMANVEDESEGDGGRWMWHAPIANWSKQECRDYIKRYEIPCNPLWDDLNRSGDCYCGCFADSVSEKVETIAAGGEGRVAWLEALEQQSNQGNEHDRWGHSSLSRNEIRAIREEQNDKQMTLCATCGIDPLDED
jgi:3'-phosphoadenosine 5'-phosphosulfate sulfotransferase (PAPS reductase)/FAD synthetase